MSYKIEIQVPADSSLHQNLQDAYDNGAAGTFTLEPVTKGVTKILFGREVSDDAAYIELRMASGYSLATAACAQLADEFEECGTSSLADVVQALRSAAARVSGLSDAVLEAERIVEVPPVSMK